MSRMLRMTEQQLADRLAGRGKARAQKPRGARAPETDWKRVLARQISHVKAIPTPILEYAFDEQLEGSGRGWRFDLCWPEYRIALEVDGAVHRIKERDLADFPKFQKAFELNYRVLHVTPSQVRHGEALELVRSAFGC